MLLRELLKLLNKVKKCHPEAADAQVWGTIAIHDDGKRTFQINFIGYDQKHEPARIKLEE